MEKRKKSKLPQESAKRPEQNYTLKSEAVEDLVTDEVTHYSEAELNRYRRKSRIHLPPLFWILFNKTWFAGAVCYFILWGLSPYVGNLLDMLFILGICLGMVTDLLTNNVLRFIEKTPGANEKYLAVTKKGIVGFFLNLVLSSVVTLCVFFTYSFINRFVVTITNDPANLFLGVEPIGFGLLCMGYDMALVGIRRLFGSILTDAKRSARHL